MADLDQARERHLRNIAAKMGNSLVHFALTSDGHSAAQIDAELIGSIRQACDASG